MIFDSSFFAERLYDKRNFDSNFAKQGNQGEKCVPY